jgi:AAA domain
MIARRLDRFTVPGVRRLRMLPALAQDPRTRLLDRALDDAGTSGWSHLELPDAPVLTADPDTIELIIDLLRRLAERGPTVQCERVASPAPLAPARIAIGVSHTDQVDQIRVALDAAGLGEVVVSTANRLQGLEFDLVIAWHPLAGLPDAPDGFHLDPGRLCVLLTRHRHACIVVGRTGDRAFLDGIPPSTPAYLGWDPDPVLDGWSVHQQVFDGLAPFRLAA